MFGYIIVFKSLMGNRKILLFGNIVNNPNSTYISLLDVNSSSQVNSQILCRLLHSYL